MLQERAFRETIGDVDPSRRATRSLRAAVATVGLVLLGGCAAGAPSSGTAPAKPAVASAPAAGPAAHDTRVAAAGGASVTPSDTPSPTRAAVRRGTALAQLDTLAVRGRAPMTGYDRDRFGQAWLDADRNGCDTRNDILSRDVRAKTFEPGTGNCVVLTGRLVNPYTAAVVPFAQGYGDDVDIDHVVALGDAWATGAWRWDIHERAALANDPLNLLAVDAHDNRQKGDGDAATWLPPAHGYRCAYVARQVAVKAKYALAVTPAEKAAIARVLRTCPRLVATADPTRAPTRVDQNIQDPGAPRSDPTNAPVRSGVHTPRGFATSGPVTYQNCDAVRAAGRAPIRRGDPGYSRSLDRDGDGVGCE